MNDKVPVKVLDGIEKLKDPVDYLLFVVDLASVAEVNQKGVEIAILFISTQTRSTTNRHQTKKLVKN